MTTVFKHILLNKKELRTQELGFHERLCNW